jgi:hypothetical protein
LLLSQPLDGGEKICFGARDSVKARPIDDCLEVQLNMGFTSTLYLKLHDVDNIASFA